MTQSRRATIIIGTGAVLGTIAFLFHLAGNRAVGRVLEIEMRTSAGEFAQLSWDAASGARAEQQPLTRTPDSFQSLRFALPSETLRSVRLSPLNRPGELVVEHLRVLEADGTLVRELNTRSLLPESQIASMRREGRLVRIVTDPNATAPSLRLTPACLDGRSPWSALSSVTPLSLSLASCACLALILSSIAVLAAETPARAVGATVTRWSPVMWLALLFLLIVSAKLLLLHVYPARVPYLDQWDAEAAGVYIPFDEGCLSWRQMVSFHNEHRIFFTRLLSLGLLMVNGQWDPQLQQIVNAGLHAMTALVVAMIFWRASDGRRLNLAVVFCAVVFTLPFGWENTLAGFQSSFYFLLLFSVLSLALTVKRVRSGAWFLGWFCVVSSLVTTAGGLFTPVATGIAAVLRLISGRCTRREAMVNLGMSGAAFALGLSLVSPAIRQSGVFVPRAFGDFMTAFAGNLAWPWVDVHWMSVIAWLPLLALVAVMLWRRRLATDQEVLMVALGSWVAIQAAGLAFARGAGGAAPASRYMDILSLGLVANAMALIALVDRFHAYRPAWRLATAVLMAWSTCAIVGSARVGGQGLAGAAERRAWMTTYEHALRSFLKDDNIAAFALKGFPEMVPHWSASMLGNAWLRHPYMREILPPAVREPLSLEPRPGATPVFVDTGVYPTTPSDVARHVRGSYTSMGNPTEGQFESLPVRCQSGAYLRFEIAGYLGIPGLSLSVRSTPGREVSVQPGELARERWIASLVRCPSDSFTIVAVDSRPDLWFAFADPIEVPWGSQIAQTLIDRAWGCVFAALGLTLLAALFDPAPLTG
jgi:hypothetical protein